MFTVDLKEILWHQLKTKFTVTSYICVANWWAPGLHLYHVSFKSRSRLVQLHCLEFISCLWQWGVNAALTALWLHCVMLRANLQAWQQYLHRWLQIISWLPVWRAVIKFNSYGCMMQWCFAWSVSKQAYEALQHHWHKSYTCPCCYGLILSLCTDPLHPRSLDLFELPFSCLVSYMYILIEFWTRGQRWQSLLYHIKNNLLCACIMPTWTNCDMHTHLGTHIHTYISTAIFSYVWFMWGSLQLTPII